MLQNLIPSFPWTALHALHPCAIQGTEGIKFSHLATLTRMSFYAFAIMALAQKFNQDGKKVAKEAFENAQQYQEKKRERVSIKFEFLI